MVGAECELAPGERDHRHGGEDDADHQEDRLRVPDEPQADGQQASSQARALAAGHPVAFFVAPWVGQHSLMFYPRQGYRQCPGQGPTRNPLADSTEERRKDPVRLPPDMGAPVRRQGPLHPKTTSTDDDAWQTRSRVLVHTQMIQTCAPWCRNP